ncbi:Emopamil-binding protein [Fistulina hepatica ATCC 64428]|uniref:Emopamil-binding protein n=1 Tax=Fistulina hepatica ATCC 64428 TaxID=1128425 RepID=A0A0D7A446_9AGAR|nr:Emopamil-binding protein [Fistulina hepatica ATCC 64428]
MTDKPLFTATSFFSLLSVALVGSIAYVASRTLLPKHASFKDRFTFIWLTFDAMTHFSFEFSWLYLSMFGRQVNTSEGMFAEMCKYVLADYRWGVADPTLVSLELLTVFGVGPLCCYSLSLLSRDDPARHYWIVVLSTAELYGDWMTFCPEWLTGSPNLDTSNALYLWVYLFLLNIIWVFIPLWLMYDSYTYIAGSLRSQQAKIKQA